MKRLKIGRNDVDETIFSVPIDCLLEEYRRGLEILEGADK